MSIRKRYWFTQKQTRKWAANLSAAAGQPDKWSKYEGAARTEMDNLLRDYRDKRAVAREHIEHMSAADRPKFAWVVDYVDQGDKRRFSTHATQDAAKAWEKKMHVEVDTGVHVSDSVKFTVKQAGDRWLKKAEDDGLERTTVDQYRQHLNYHIVPYLGGTRLSRLSIPVVHNFQSRLRNGDPTLPDDDITKAPRSAEMVKRATSSLRAILADAQDAGLVARNVVSEMSKRRRQRDKVKHGKGRRKKQLEVDVDIPTPGEMSAIIAAVQGKWRPFFYVAAFTGLRASELRGLRWKDVEINKDGKGKITVSQRADRYKEIGHPKSDAGKRTVPIGPVVANVLRQWKLECPKGKLGLVFPTNAGAIQNHANIIKLGVKPTMIAAGVTVETKKKDADGNPILAAKYTGMHAFRHFFASWCLNRENDGGRGLQPMRVKYLMGHSTIQVTTDIYGHLFPDTDDAALADDEQKLLAAVRVA